MQKLILVTKSMGITSVHYAVKVRLKNHLVSLVKPFIQSVWRVVSRYDHFLLPSWPFHSFCSTHYRQYGLHFVPSFLTQPYCIYYILVEHRTGSCRAEMWTWWNIMQHCIFVETKKKKKCQKYKIINVHPFKPFNVCTIFWVYLSNICLYIGGTLVALTNRWGQKSVGVIV